MQESATPLHKLGRSLFEEGQSLRRQVWQPLRRTLELFHVVPVTAAVIVFILLATDGQLREIYLSYLEDLKEGPDRLRTMTHLAAAAAGFMLLSAAFYEAHYQLSTMRINVIYSSLS